MAGDEHMSDGEDYETIDGLIDEALDKLGVNIDTVDGRTRSHLRKIETALKAELEARREAEAEVRRHNLSVVSVAKASGVSHATFYNRPILTRYVNQFRDGALGRTEASVVASLRRRLEEAQRQIDLMNEQGALMVQQQHEIELLKQKNRILQAQLNGGQPAMDGKGEIIPFGGKGA